MSTEQHNLSTFHIDNIPSSPRDDAEAKRFYSAVRENVIALLSFLALWFLALFLVRRLRRRLKSKSMHLEEYDDDRIDDEFVGADALIPLTLCISALAFALAGFMLLPSTMVATALLQEVHHFHALRWLDESLLNTLWNYTFIGGNVALFLLVPFAYFFNESAQHFSFLAKARETLVSLALVGALVYGFVFVTKLLLHVDIPDWFFLNLTTCFGGTLLCVRAVPRGLLSIFEGVAALPLRLNHRRKHKHRLAQLQFEGEMYRRKLEVAEFYDADERRKRYSTGIRRDMSASVPNTKWEAFMALAGKPRVSRSTSLPPPKINPRRRLTREWEAAAASPAYPGLSSNGSARLGHTPASSISSSLSASSLSSAPNPKLPTRDEIVQKLAAIEKERKRAEEQVSQSPIVRNLAFLLIFPVNLVLYALLMLHIARSLVWGLWEQKIPTALQHGFLIRSGTKWEGVEEVVLDVVMILYFTLAAIVGAYHVAPFDRLRPRFGRLGLQELALNTCLLLALGCSLPTVVDILGLGDFESVGPYDVMHHLQGGMRYWTAFFVRGAIFTACLWGVLDKMVGRVLKFW
ncbi:uncharacterized protein VTP21DRAFT_8763 [Calcarisporiella thermophila]|uniref:uncharacterized protein n=1 Tax=Calcarisporiella thermophila TaxID=911321 RepID=UPI0037436BC3